MVEIRKPIQVVDAVNEVMKYQHLGNSEVVDFSDCDNRRLAEPIIADSNVPSFDKSPYDGFALRSRDTEHALPENPVEFEVVDHIGAGQVSSEVLKKGQATRIMTGAQIPEGADCVVMFEVCQAYEKNKQNYIAITSTVKKGQNIVVKGSEVEKGQHLIDAGTLINPGVKALLATFGYAKVAVAKKPIVGIIATGSELLDVDEKLEPGKIRNSNAYMICSQVNRLGAKYKYLGKLDDELDLGFSTIKNAIKEVDILITTGGVSVGDFDLMPDIYDMLGAEILFNKIAMRPGSVTTVAKLGEKLLFGLSGNPSACYVGFELFARPVIQSFLYNKKPYMKRIKAVLADEFPKSNPFTRFVRSYLDYESGTVQVKLAGIDKSNVVTSLANTTCLMQLPGGTAGYTVGSEVEVLLLNDMDGQNVF